MRTGVIKAGIATERLKAARGAGWRAGAGAGCRGGDRDRAIESHGIVNSTLTVNQQL